MNTTTHTIGMITLAIDNMTCGHCVRAVTQALSAVPGITVNSVSVGSAVIETADGWASGKAVNALDAAGYPARAVGGAAAVSATSPAKSGGGCCGGASDASADHKSGGKGSSGCCR